MMNAEQFRQWLTSMDYSSATVKRYTGDIALLNEWLGSREPTQANLVEYKEKLSEQGYAPVTVNRILAAINTYCRFAQIAVRLRYLRIQRRMFRDESRELTKKEYERLISVSEKSGRRRLALLFETVGSTGIRVSEVSSITVENVKLGKARIAMKGKIREILLPGRLCRKLLKFAKEQKIAAGEIFVTGSGKRLSRGSIWAEMKSVCGRAGVDPRKVFPHNLRHLFARVFYSATRDIAKLADVLGHSSIETSRIYLIGTGAEHKRLVDSLNLVL